MQLYWNHTSAWVLSCKFTACLQNNPFEKHLSGNTFDVWLKSRKICLLLLFLLLLLLLLLIIQTYLRSLLQGQWDAFPIEGAMKYFRIKRMAEIKIFWPWCLLYNGFFIKQTFIFLFINAFFISLFCKKSERGIEPLVLLV